jgi:hypothetical protein
MPRCHECGRILDEDGAESSPAVASAGDAAEERPDPTAPQEPERCPACGSHVEPDRDGEEEEPPVKSPWHFKVLVVGTVVYLGYRLYQGIGWLIHHA